MSNLLGGHRVRPFLLHRNNLPPANANHPAKSDGAWVFLDATFGDTAQNYDKYFAMSKDTASQIYTIDHKWA